jgi:hypothetical protein
MVLNITKWKAHTIFVGALPFFAYFPYIRTSPLASDTQPHFIMALVVGFLIISALKGRAYISYPALGFSIYFGTVGVLLSAPLSDVVSIVVLFFSMWLFLDLAKRNSEVVVIILKIVVVAYFIVGCAQWLGVNTFDVLVSNIRTSENRGVPSLASEPSFFGLLALATIISLEVYSIKSERTFQALGLICVLMSASLTAILPTIGVILVYGMAKLNFRSLMYVGILAGLVLIAVGNYTGRAVNLIDLAINNPDLLLQDPSLINRISRSFGALAVAYEDNFIPHNFSGLGQSLSASSLAELNVFTGEVERLSNIGSIFVYGFGFLSIPLLLYVFYIRQRIDMPAYLFVSIIVFITANISIATPYVGLILLAPRILYLRRTV